MTTRIKVEGPIFDGEAEKAAAEFSAALGKQIALIGQNWIQIAAQGYDKSGRNTGAASDAVKVVAAGGRWTITGGMRPGSYNWPWLEGTSRRNQSTGFKGYQTFKKTRGRMRGQVTPWARLEMAKFIERMGGGEA